ncbi:MAG TPA: hypothetical protein VLY04_24305 [Bryobacteraceae bacterium]|nr:hypothetical protein [Bryobacteraceae bacterium]
MNFITAVQALVDHGVDFVIIGGWSAVLHGSAYLTNHLDLCFSRRADNLQRLTKALAPYHPRLRDLPPDLPFVWDEATLGSSTMLTFSTDLGFIDLLAEVTGLGGFEEVQARSIQVQAFDRIVRTLDLSSLIESKRAAGREKDLRLLPELESLLDAGEPQ